VRLNKACFLLAPTKTGWHYARLTVADICAEDWNIVPYPTEHKVELSVVK